MSELFDNKQMHKKKKFQGSRRLPEKNFQGSCRLSQAHKKLCNENETNNLHVMMEGSPYKVHTKYWGKRSQQASSLGFLFSDFQSVASTYVTLIIHSILHYFHQHFSCPYSNTIGNPESQKELGTFLLS